MMFVFFPPLKPMLFQVSLPPTDSLRLQAKVAAGASQRSFSDVDGMVSYGTSR